MKATVLSLLLFFLCSITMSQEITIKGKVVDQAGMPLPGASVFVEGTNIGVTTNFDGNYSISFNESNLGTNGGTYQYLIASFLGYSNSRMEIGSNTTIDFKLKEDNQSLEEVVVTAQGISKEKRSLGYAITKLNSEEVEKRAEADVSNTLQGKIAGVQINAVSGQTGEDVDIKIRSSLSINQSNSPLIIVDNIPFSGSLQDIDANNIESLSVLKGLNASILYGSEGRNGVILIQTKSGDGNFGKKELQVNISHTTYFNKIANLPKYQNKYGAGSDFRFAGSVGTWGPAFDDLDVVPHPYAYMSDIFPEFANVEVPYKAAPNNVKDIFKTGMGNISSFNLSSSQEKSVYNISLGYTDEEGIIGNNDLKRFNFGLGGAIELTNKLTIGATLNYSTRKINRLQTETIFDRLLYIPRNIDLLSLPFENPQTGASVNYRSAENPLWILNNTGDKNEIVRTFATLNANYYLTKSLSLNYRVGIDSDIVDGFDYSNKGGYGVNELGFLNLDYHKEVIVDQSFILSVKNVSLTEKFGIDAQLGVNSKFMKGKRNSSNSNQQIVFGFLNPENYAVSVAGFEEYNENLAGLFGQFQFSYDRFLYITLSGRNDWGSTVEKENRSLFYPGVSLSFIPTSIINTNSSLVSYLKLRGAYASSSGYPNRFQTREFLQANPRRFIDVDGNAIVSNGFPNLFPNPNLKPELHKEYEIGLEGRFLNNTLTLESSLFKRISENQILLADRPPATGYSKTTINAGRIDTKGIEINLGIDLFERDNFTWNLNNIFTAYESTVVDLPQDRISMGGNRYAIEGLPFGVIRSDYGLTDDEGNYLINPENGFLITSSSVGIEDMVIGDPNPDWLLTMINTLNYKGFRLSAQIEYLHGGDILSRQVGDFLTRGVTRDTENREGSFVLPGVLGNPNTGDPYLDTNGNTIENTIQTNGNRLAYQSYYVPDNNITFDGSTLRIREIQLSYKLDKKNYKKIPFNDITFSVGARNVWFKAYNFPKYVNYDPENNGGLGGRTVPTNKRISLGISASF